MDPKQNVLGAALRVFARHGFRKSSMSMVAAEANVTRQAVYHHFTSKEALFEALVDQLQSKALADARRFGEAESNSALSSTLFRTLIAYHQSLVAHVSNSPYMAELLEESSRHCADTVATHARKLEELVTKLVKTEVRNGRCQLKHELSEKEFIRLVLVASKGVKVTYAHAGAKAHSSALRQMIEIVCDGSMEREQVYQIQNQKIIMAGRSKQ